MTAMSLHPQALRPTIAFSFCLQSVDFVAWARLDYEFRRNLITTVQVAYKNEEFNGTASGSIQTFVSRLRQPDLQMFESQEPLANY